MSFVEIKMNITFMYLSNPGTTGGQACPGLAQFYFI